MWDRIYPYFLWTEKTWLGHTIRESKWTFSITEVFHLLGLTMLLGTVLVMALRLLGLAFRSKSVREVARGFAPWSAAALVIVLTTGFLLFVSEATKCWGNIAFRYKMLFLFLALVFQFAVLPFIYGADEKRFPPVARKIAAVIAVFLWFGVAAAGRAIAFF